MNTEDYARELLKTKKMSLYLEDGTGNILDVRRIKRKDIDGSPVFLVKEIYMNPKIGRECEPEIFREIHQLEEKGVLKSCQIKIRNYSEKIIDIEGNKHQEVWEAYYFINGKK